MPGNHNHYRDREFSRGHMSGGQTEKVLRDIGQNVLDAARAALEAGANEVLADAKSRCPVKSGKLCDSIKLVRGRGGSYFKISANACYRCFKFMRGTNEKFFLGVDENLNTFDQFIDATAQRLKFCRNSFDINDLEKVFIHCSKFCC